MTLSVELLSRTLASASLTGQRIEDVLLALSLLRRIWDHLVFESQIPSRLPFEIVQFLAVSLHQTVAEIETLWNAVKDLASSWDTHAFDAIVDDCFRQYGQPHGVGQQCFPRSLFHRHLLDWIRC